MKIKSERKQEILEIIINHVDKVIKIFLFGSRASSREKERSDIDIGIIAKKPVPFSVLAKIDDKIEELDTLLKFDIVDFTDRDDGFTKEALKKIEVWYEKK